MILKTIRAGQSHAEQGDAGQGQAGQGQAGQGQAGQGQAGQGQAGQGQAGQGQAGQGAPLVLLHGLFGSASNWGRIQRRLAETHDVLALDLRNHGNSTHATPTDYPTMAADVVETLAHHGITRFALLGHSMGGKVAMRLALDNPALVTRLLIADIAPVAYPPHFRTLAAAMQAMPLPPGLTRAAASHALEHAAPDPAIRAFVLQNLRFADPPTWRIGLDEIAASLPAIESWESGGTYPGPTLVLRGETSDYILPEHRALFRALFPAARFATLRGAGHWLHADNPEGFLLTVQPFFAPLSSTA